MTKYLPHPEMNNILAKRSAELRKQHCYSTWYYDEYDNDIVICTTLPGLWIGRPCNSNAFYGSIFRTSFQIKKRCWSRDLLHNFNTYNYMDRNRPNRHYDLVFISARIDFNNN